MKVKLLLTFALLLTAVTGAWADDDSGSCGTSVSYSYVESTHTLTISGTGAMADYENPSERPWNSYVEEIETIVIEDGVTTIGKYAFNYCSGLTTITIPASVTSIGDYAFYDCSGLTSVTIPASVTTIGDAAFFNCSGLTAVTIPSSVTTIGVEAFSYCSNIATMTVEDGNTKYDSRNGCNAIIEQESNTLIAGCKNTIIPDDVTNIDNNAFEGCSDLTTVTIPASVKSIGSYAFSGCSGLTTITIPASVTSIGYAAFAGCNNLATMTVDAGNKVYDSRNSCNAIIEQETKTLIAGCKNTIIPDDVTRIGDVAFQGCSGLTTVTIPAGVTYIGYDAFYNCTKVEVVYCNADPEELTWDEGGCDDFKDDGSTIIHVANAAPWIAKFTGVVRATFSDTPYVPLTWNYDAGTKTLTFSGTAIPSYNDPDERPWKDYVSEVEKIVISDDVTTIGDVAFQDCTGLTTVTIPAGVTYIGYDAFYKCTAVTDVYCNADPLKLTWEENGCDDFKYDGSTIIHVADADPWYTKFGGVVHGIFRDPSTVPLTWNYDAGTKTLTFSGTEAIPSCNDSDKRPWIDYVSEVENIVINEGVRGIGNYAFYNCDGLTTVTIPASVKSIGSYAFEDCYSLTTVTIGSGVTNICYAAFAGCSNLATMTVDAGNTKYDSRNGCNAIIEKETNTLIAGCKNSTIPASVTSIGVDAFIDCTSLTSVTIPAGVTSIGDYAFGGCSGLTTVTIGSGVTYIGYDAFYNCIAVTDVYCYADPEELTWDESGCNDFKYDGSTKTECHVTDAAPWSAMFTDVNVTFVGDLAPEAVTKAAGEEYWSSYYNSATHLKADDNTTVYKATLSGTTVTLTEITDKVITAGQAVLLKKTTTDAVELTPCADASTDDYSGNDLEGVDAETAKESGSDYYVLSYKDSKLSFYKYSGATLGANKAFFKIPANSSREFLDILGEVTGIDGLNGELKNGKIEELKFYDLNGRRVMNPTKKGVYINNGRKVVIK